MVMGSVFLLLTQHCQDDPLLESECSCPYGGGEKIGMESLAGSSVDLLNRSTRFSRFKAGIRGMASCLLCRHRNKVYLSGLK